MNSSTTATRTPNTPASNPEFGSRSMAMRKSYRRGQEQNLAQVSFRGHFLTSLRSIYTRHSRLPRNLLLVQISARTKSNWANSVSDIGRYLNQYCQAQFLLEVGSTVEMIGTSFYSYSAMDLFQKALQKYLFLWNRSLSNKDQFNIEQRSIVPHHIYIRYKNVKTAGISSKFIKIWNIQPENTHHLGNYVWSPVLKVWT